EVALLRGRQLVVEHDDVDVERVGKAGELGGLALADVRRGVRAVAPLELAVHDLRAGRVGEQRELVERGFGGRDAAGVRGGAEGQRALAPDGEGDSGRGEPPLAPILMAAVAARPVAHASCSRSIVTSKTWTTGPPRWIVAPSCTRRSPPSTCTV